MTMGTLGTRCMIFSDDDNDELAEGLPGDTDEPEPLEEVPAPERGIRGIEAERASLRRRVGEQEVVGGVTWTVVEEVDTDASSVDGELLPVAPHMSSSFLASSESLELDAAAAEDLESVDMGVEADAFVQLLWSDVSAMITAVNVAGAKDAKATGRFKKSTECEFGVFLGMMIGAVAFVEKGRQLWRRPAVVEAKVPGDWQ